MATCSAELVGVAGGRRVVSGKWANACPPYIFGQVASFDPQTNLFGVWLWGMPARHISNIKILDGVFMCAKREVAQAVPFDAQTFDGFHGYDVDFSFRAYQAVDFVWPSAAICCCCIGRPATGTPTGKRYESRPSVRSTPASSTSCAQRRGHAYRHRQLPDAAQELVELMTPAWDGMEHLWNVTSRP